MTVTGRSWPVAALLAGATLVVFVALAPAGGGIKCDGRAVDIAGTSGADTIVGTDRVDFIHGRGGDDLIFGLDQADHICGGGGTDILHGGSRSDDLFGGTGTDHIFGDEGRDELFGGPGAEIRRRTIDAGEKDGPGDAVGRRGGLFAGPGDDKLDGGPDKDFCAGDQGEDTADPDCEEQRSIERDSGPL
jgi:Ca2+-binding RTX toxin-like protein